MTLSQTMLPFAALGGLAFASLNGFRGISASEQDNAHWQQLPLRVVVEGIPQPKRMMQIKENETFVVPAGQTLVLTGIAHRQASGAVQVMVDGQLLITTPGDELLTLPTGIAIDGGSTVEIAGINNPLLLGYLSD